MPIHKVKQNGKTMYRWGDHGHLYPTRAGAVKQAVAAYSAGYTKKEESLDKSLTQN